MHKWDIHRSYNNIGSVPAVVENFLLNAQTVSLLITVTWCTECSHSEAPLWLIRLFKFHSCQHASLMKAACLRSCWTSSLAGRLFQRAAGCWTSSGRLDVTSWGRHTLHMQSMAVAQGSLGVLCLSHRCSLLHTFSPATAKKPFKQAVPQQMFCFSLLQSVGDGLKHCRQLQPHPPHRGPSR